MERSSDNKSIINDNSGLSIVEVLVAVAILAIVFVPLLKTFTQASTINIKAQKLQNVTSLAEGVMEDVKGKSIQELHDLAVDDSRVSFSPLDEDGTLTKGNLKNVPPYIVKYENITATQGIKYDAEVTISTEKYKSTDRKNERESNPDVAGDVSDANIRELPQINKVDSNRNAVLSWEINKYDNKALENLAAENSVSDSDIATLKNSYKTTGTTDEAEKYINIEIKDDIDTSSTKVSCEVEYKTGDATDKSLRYLVYTGYFPESGIGEPSGPDIYLFYTLSEKVKDGASNIADPIKKEHIKIEDKTTGKRHNVYFIMQDGLNTLGTLNGSKVSLEVSGSGYESSISYNETSIITDASSLLSGASTADESDDVYFFSNLKDKYGNNGELFNSKSKDRIYYVTVEIKEHGKTEVLGTYTSTMQTGEEAE